RRLRRPRAPQGVGYDDARLDRSAPGPEGRPAHAGRPRARRGTRRLASAPALWRNQMTPWNRVSVAALFLGIASVSLLPAAPPAKPGSPASQPSSSGPRHGGSGNQTPPVAHTKPTVDEARRFVDAANTRLLELNNRLQRAQWVGVTYITDDTEKISSEYNEESIGAVTALA